MDMLKRLVLSGFKSIKSMDLELRPLNVLIGANGAGKSNLVSFFKMLNAMLRENLRTYVAMSGHAHSILHYGPKVTSEVRARLEFVRDLGTTSFDVRLQAAGEDTLIFAEETLSWTQANSSGPPGHFPLGGGRHESRIRAVGAQGNRFARTLLNLINGCRVYHFHDTTSTARVMQFGYIGDNSPLSDDGGNLAAFLYRLKSQGENVAYQRMVSTVRMIAPYFDDFVLEPDSSKQIILNWREKDSDLVFGPHQLSDGTLRAMFLVALLLQPETELPRLLIIDEPELGLHPYALNAIASLIKTASHHTQVLVSTQSSSFLDQFDPSDLVVVDRQQNASVFTRPDPVALESWLEEYSLGEVWEKNVIAGGPHSWPASTYVLRG
jgi:predicted ATPase